jgi:hypothetical protein
MGLIDDVVSGLEGVGIQAYDSVKNLAEEGVHEVQSDLQKAVDWFSGLPAEAQKMLDSVTSATTEKAAQILHEAGVVASDAAKDIMAGIDAATKPISELLKGAKDAVEKAISNNPAS